MAAWVWPSERLAPARARFARSPTHPAWMNPEGWGVGRTPSSRATVRLGTRPKSRNRVCKPLAAFLSAICQKKFGRLRQVAKTDLSAELRSEERRVGKECRSVRQP